VNAAFATVKGKRRYPESVTSVPTIHGRKGWLHVLDGFEEKHIVMDKELS
jgi:hypothetical protein